MRSIACDLLLLFLLATLGIVGLLVCDSWEFEWWLKVTHTVPFAVLLVLTFVTDISKFAIIMGMLGAAIPLLVGDFYYWFEIYVRLPREGAIGGANIGLGFVMFSLPVLVPILSIIGFIVGESIVSSRWP